MATYLTEQDVQNYGTDLIDLTQRSALTAVQPHLETLARQNEALQQQLAREARFRLDQQVERAVPNFREIDKDANWHRFLLSPHPLTGLPRQQWLNDAIARGDANRVIAFFKGFLREEGQAPERATGQARTRSTHTPSGKPIYTREQIGELYARHRKGELVGAEWDRIEADVFAAQHESRIAGVYLTK